MKKLLILLFFFMSVPCFSFPLGGWYGSGNGGVSVKIVDGDDQIYFNGSDQVIFTDGTNDITFTLTGAITLSGNTLNIIDNEGNTTTIDPDINGFKGDGTHNVTIDSNGRSIVFNPDSNKSRNADLSFIKAMVGTTDFIYYAFYDDDGSEYSRYTGLDMSINGSPSFGTQGEMRYIDLDDSAASAEYLSRTKTSPFGSGDNPSAKYTRIAVFYPHNIDSATIYGIWDQDTKQQGRIGKGTGGTFYCLVGGNGNYVGRKTNSSKVIANKWFVGAATFDNDGANSDEMINTYLYNLTDGTKAYDTTDVVSGTFTTPLDASSVLVTLGIDKIAGLFNGVSFDGYIAFVIQIHRVLTEEECDQFAEYFKNKLGL